MDPAQTALAKAAQARLEARRAQLTARIDANDDEGIDALLASCTNLLANDPPGNLARPANSQQRLEQPTTPEAPKATVERPPWRAPSKQPTSAPSSDVLARAGRPSAKWAPKVIDEPKAQAMQPKPPAALVAPPQLAMPKVPPPPGLAQPSMAAPLPPPKVPPPELAAPLPPPKVPPPELAVPPPPPLPPPAKLEGHAQVPAHMRHATADQLARFASSGNIMPPPPAIVAKVVTKVVVPAHAQQPKVAKQRVRGTDPNSSWHTAWHRAKKAGPEALRVFRAVWPKPKSNAQE